MRAQFNRAEGEWPPSMTEGWHISITVSDAAAHPYGWDAIISSAMISLYWAGLTEKIIISAYLTSAPSLIRR